MGKAENIRVAKEEIAKRRSDSIAAFNRRTNELKLKYPEFVQIDSKLEATGIKILGAAVKKDSVMSVQEIREEYEQLVRQKKDFLASHGYSEDYCDIKYSCSRCSDTGYVGIDICDCLKKEFIKASFASSGLYSLVNTQTFETFSTSSIISQDDRALMEHNLSVLKNYAEGFTAEKSDSFLFIGATGLGKTHLSSAIAKVVIEKGNYVVYESAINLFAEFEAERFGTNRFSADAVFDTEKYTECDLLIIDDLGCEMTNQFTISCLYNIINTRMIRHLSTVISTNLTQNELRKRYTDRIISRIFGEYKPLLFSGNDYREQKIRMNLR